VLRTALPQLRALHPGRTPARNLVAGLVLALSAACGSRDGDGGGAIDLGTGPGEFPKVQGYFQRNEAVGAVTCTTPPPAGGDIAMGSYNLSEPVGFTQSGSKVSIVLVNYPGDPPDTGSVDMTGKVTLGFKLSMKERNLRSGGRQFYVDVTGSFVLNRSTDGTKLTGTGSYENLLREGSATAPVFATCTRSSTIELTRTGG
jgi:hypothetical protein